MGRNHLARNRFAILFAALAVASGTVAAHADEQKTLCNQAAYEMGLKWQQQSAEVAALQRQTYALAKLRLHEALAAHKADG